MHIVLGVLAAIAGIIFYISWAARSASDLADSANELGNLPRKLRYRKKAGKQGLDLVNGPVEAATVLMIAVARMDRLGRVTDTQSREIAEALVSDMQLERAYAEDLIVQMRSLSQHLNQPDSTLFPMIRILQQTIGRDDAKDLAAMLKRVAAVEGQIEPDQSSFIRRYEDRMGLLG